MMRARLAAVVCAGGLAASALLARVHPFGDAGLFGTQAGMPRMNQTSIPADARAVLAAKCADCHSMQTRVPLYGRLAPASWLMERDIVEARKRMNLSLWDGYTADQQQTLKAKIVQQTLKAKIVQQTQAHKMPPAQYLLIHQSARITEADVQIFVRWARTDVVIEAGPVASVSGGGAGDAVKGKETFEKRCTGCHAMESDREGPRLQGVYGRSAGTVAGFTYSAGLRKAGIVWDDASLEKWLTDPDGMVRDNNMEFRVGKAEERRDLIAFMKQSGGK